MNVLLAYASYDNFKLEKYEFKVCVKLCVYLMETLPKILTEKGVIIQLCTLQF